MPIEQKESMKWLRSYRAVSEVQALCPDTALVSVGDRVGLCESACFIAR